MILAARSAPGQRGLIVPTRELEPTLEAAWLAANVWGHPFNAAERPWGPRRRLSLGLHRRPMYGYRATAAPSAAAAATRPRSREGTTSGGAQRGGTSTLLPHLQMAGQE
jgi:hypothetical protein